MNKLTNLSIILRSLLRFLFRGISDKKPRDLKSILIMQATPNLGDMVCITPMFRAIKRKYPGCRLILMCGGKGAEIIKGNPYVDEYMTTKESADNMIKKLQAKKIDFAAATNPSTSGLGTLYLSGIPCISSFFIPGNQKVYSRMYDLLRRFVIQIPLKPGLYIPGQYLKLLEPIGIAGDDLRFELFYSKEAYDSVSKMLETNNVDPDRDLIVAIAPGGSTDIRWWSAEKYAALADYLYEKYRAKVFFIGAGSDRKPIEDTINLLDKETRYVSLLNQPIEEFKAFMSRVNLVIGNDSGPMTIAKAFGAAQMVFIGPTDEREYQLPNSPRNRIVKSKTRGMPLTNSANWNFYDEKEARRQIGEITLEDGINELENLMKALTK